VVWLALERDALRSRPLATGPINLDVIGHQRIEPHRRQVRGGEFLSVFCVQTLSGRYPAEPVRGRND